MTTAFAVLLFCLAGAAVVLALVTFYWVNRTPPLRRFDEYGRVPLFGVEVGAGARTADGTAGDDEARPPLELMVSSEPAPVDAEAAMAPVETPWPTGTPVLVAPADNEIAPVSNGVVPAVKHTAAIVPPPAEEKAPGADGNGVVPAAKPSNPASPPPIPVITGDVDSSPVAIKEILTGTNGTVAESTNLIVPPAINRTVRPRGDGWGLNSGWSTPRASAPVTERRLPEPPRPPSNGTSVNSNGVPGSMVEGHNLRFSIPAEGTLQFLPGRLEISSGLDTGREIRFVRVPGPNGTEVTFGRNEGPLYRHIQLRDKTVSREHAKMTLAEGRWQLSNLSRTNPVAHNGHVLGYGEQQPLEDGDRIEMGEVVFSFRSR